MLVCAIQGPFGYLALRMKDVMDGGGIRKEIVQPGEGPTIPRDASVLRIYTRTHTHLLSLDSLLAPFDYTTQPSWQNPKYLGEIPGQQQQSQRNWCSAFWLFAGRPI